VLRQPASAGLVVSFTNCIFDRTCPMPDGLLPILVLIVVVIVYTIAKVVQSARKSDEQWQQVDKSKLRQWDDDD
jgi:hypothetical protein